jgi:hypothetical protein
LAVPDRPVLITDAQRSADEELASRQRRYTITMLIRIPLIVGGAILAAQHLVVLGVIVVLLSVPLPWVAVLIANDRPPVNAKRRRVLPGTISYDRAIEPTTHVIDEERDAESEPTGHRTD